MRASILSLASFRLRRDGAAAVQQLNWSQQELAELYRVRDRLVQSGLRVALDVGLTDEGEPWAVFLQSESGDAFVHIARLNGEIVIANIMASVVYRGRDFRTITDQMLRDAPLVMPSAKGDSKVVMHPRSVFTAFVAAAVVLSEFVRSIESAKAASEQEKASQDKAVAETKAMFPVIFDRILARDSGWTAAIGSHGAAASLMAAAVGAVLIADDHTDDVAPIASLVLERSGADAEAASAIENASARAERAAAEAAPTEQAAEADYLSPETKLVTAAPAQAHAEEEHSAAIETPVTTDPRQLAELPAREPVLPAEVANMASLAKSASSASSDTSGPDNSATSAQPQTAATSETRGGKEVSQILDSIIVARLGDGAAERSITQALDRVIDGGAQPTESSKEPTGPNPAGSSSSGQSETNGWILHTAATDRTPATMNEGRHDVVLITGENLTIYNFRFSEDYLLFDGEIDSMEWIKSIDVEGDDVRIVATNGSIISLIDTHGLIA